MVFASPSTGAPDTSIEARRAPFQRGEWPVCSQQIDPTVTPSRDGRATPQPS